MSICEGNFEIDEQGRFLINKEQVHAGSVIKVKFQGKWIEVCIERAHGTYYSIPNIDLSSVLNALRVE